MITLAQLRRDIPAGLVVALVALPLCLGIAQACGVSPFIGLLTGAIGGLVVTTFSPSRFAVSGPAAGLVTIVVVSIEDLGSFTAFLFALALSGLLQFLFGLARLGRFISLVPGSVIKGMLAAIGLLLIFQQLPVAIGAPLSTLSENISLATLAVTLTGLAILFLWNSTMVKQCRWLSWAPGPLVAVLSGILISQLTGSHSLAYVSLPAFDGLDSLFAEPEQPDWQAWRNPSVYGVALTLALVASLETLLSQQALDKLRPQYPAPSANKELCAQGVGNILSGLLGGLPITSVIVRGSVNVSAGAQSKVSVLLHGLLLLLSALWFSTLLSLIPMASLAAILLHTGYKLATPKLFISQLSCGQSRFVPFIVTVIGIIVFGMLAGIGLGIATQLLFSLYHSHRNALLLTRYDDHYVLRFQQNLSFVHAPALQKLLNKIPENSVLLVDRDNAGYIDPDIRTILDDFGDHSEKRGIRLAQWPAG